MRCAITGSAGFIGGTIARRFADDGWSVLHLGRRRNPAADEFHAYDLSSDPKSLPWNEIDALVHCAYDFGLTRWEDIESVNVRGSIRLLCEAKAQGVKHAVFISSFSCFDGCRSLYGRAKLLVEAEAIRLGFAVVRPGLVYGGEYSGGIVGKMEHSVATCRIIPLIGDGSYPQYPVHVDDVAEFVFRLCQSGAPLMHKPLSAAPPDKVTLRGILETIAARTGRHPIFLPIPWRLIHAGLKGLELLRLPTPFRSDSVLGIVFQNPNPDFQLPPQLEMTFRRFR